VRRAYVRITVWWGEHGRGASAERGATAVEYALMLALIAAVIVVAVTALGNNSSQRFDDFSNSLAGAS
jgi:pilus assembly protein Flp/PilA